MGTFTVKIGVGNMDRGEYVYTDALVDTGSNYSMFPQDFLNDIQVEPFNWQASVVFADGTVHSMPVGPAYLNLQDREGPCVVMFSSPGVFIIGATALENLGFAVDPVNQCLIPNVIQGRPF